MKNFNTEMCSINNEDTVFLNRIIVDPTENNPKF